jgi:hypothetical protein
MVLPRMPAWGSGRIAVNLRLRARAILSTEGEQIMGFGGF